MAAQLLGKELQQKGADEFEMLPFQQINNLLKQKKFSYNEFAKQFPEGTVIQMPSDVIVFFKFLDLRNATAAFDQSTRCIILSKEFDEKDKLQLLVFVHEVGHLVTFNEKQINCIPFQEHIRLNIVDVLDECTQYVREICHIERLLGKNINVVSSEEILSVCNSESLDVAQTIKAIAEEYYKYGTVKEKGGLTQPFWLFLAESLYKSGVRTVCVPNNKGFLVSKDGQIKVKDCR